MPYIPPFGPDGTALDPVHASLQHTVSRVLSSLQGIIPEHHALMPRGLGNYNSVNASAIFDMNQQRTRQIVATTSSTLSLASALMAVLWFFMMRRNFRRDLVLLLILGGAFKSLWFVVFSVYSFVHGPVQTASGFCQANGYLLQVGFEQCDVAVLFMSMHMYYQIFPTQRFGLGHDGLYRVRKWVYAAWVILPNLSAALAFVNPRSAFMATGGFCALPIRPYWYRVALFWGPRYLIWCYVVFVAVRIYRYVGSEFKVFGHEKDRSSSLGVPGNSSVDRMMKLDMDMNRERQQSQRISSIGIAQDYGECAPDDASGVCAIKPKTTPLTDSPKVNLANYSRRQSTPNWTTNMTAVSEDAILAPPPTLSYPSSRRGSQQIGNGVIAEDFAPPLPMVVFNGRRGSVTSVGSKLSSAAASFDSPSGLPCITERLSKPKNVEESRPTPSGALKLRRRLIQRQLRLLFIYPCIYMLLWVIPLVVNIMNYTDYFAQHPVFSIGILQLVCVTIMTFADVTVFCWRERPWRHIPGSDGTFVGSLMFWRYCFGTQWHQDRRASRVAPSYLDDEKTLDDEEASGSRTGLLSTLKRWSLGRMSSSPRGSDASDPKRTKSGSTIRPTPHKRTFSGGSDRKQMEATLAGERLALERRDYEKNRRSLQERGSSVISQQHVVGTAALPDKERKEWFDQDQDLFADEEEKSGR